MGLSARASYRPPILSAALTDRVAIDPGILVRAESEVTRVYGTIGVVLMWKETVDVTSDCHVRIIVAPTAIRSKDLNAGALGLTPQTANGRARTGYVFYDRVVQVGSLYGVDVAAILGLVIAHEIGHMLLPDGRHAQRGVMKQKWDLSQAVRAQIGALAFSKREAELIRSRAMGCQAP